MSDEEYEVKVDLAVEFWDHMTEVVTPWLAIAEGSLRVAEARVNYLSSYALALWAVGNAGQAAMLEGGDWKARMEALGDINWLKTNQEWQGICMQGTEVVTRGPTRVATANLLRWHRGLGPKPEPVV